MLERACLKLQGNFHLDSYLLRTSWIAQLLPNRVLLLNSLCLLVAWIHVKAKGFWEITGGIWNKIRLHLCVQSYLFLLVRPRWVKQEREHPVAQLRHCNKHVWMELLHPSHGLSRKLNCFVGFSMFHLYETVKLYCLRCCNGFEQREASLGWQGRCSGLFVWDCTLCHVNQLWLQAWFCWKMATLLRWAKGFLGCTCARIMLPPKDKRKKKRLGILPPLLGPSFCLEWICLYLPKNVGVGVSNLVSATRYPQPRVERAHAVGNTTFASWNSRQSKCSNNGGWSWELVASVALVQCCMAKICLILYSI